MQSLPIIIAAWNRQTQRFFLNWWLFPEAATTVWVQWPRDQSVTVGAPRCTGQPSGAARTPVTLTTGGAQTSCPSSQCLSQSPHVVIHGAPGEANPVPTKQWHAVILASGLLTSSLSLREPGDIWWNKQTKSCNPALAVKSGSLKSRPQLLGAVPSGSGGALPGFHNSLGLKKMAFRSLSLQ